MTQNWKRGQTPSCDAAIAGALLSSGRAAPPLPEQARPLQPENQTANQKEIIMADTASIDPWIGKYVIVRCRDAGVHAGILKSRSERQCELTGSRRLWYWRAGNNSAFLSGVATEGLDSASKVGAPVDILLTENCEIIACTKKAQASISEMPNHEPR
jgi:hypothetical protein